MFVCYCVFNPRIRCLTTANCWPFLSSRIQLICGIKQPFKTAFRCTTLRLGMPWQKRLEKNLSLKTKQDAFNGYCRTSTLGRRKSQQALGHQNGSCSCWRWSVSHKSCLKLAHKKQSKPQALAKASPLASTPPSSAKRPLIRVLTKTDSTCSERSISSTASYNEHPSEEERFPN